jgi:multicomponent K+:H+ antiporter subunit A
MLRVAMPREMLVLLPLLVSLPFLGAAILACCGGLSRWMATAIALAAALSGLLILLVLAGSALGGGAAPGYHMPWVPSLGLAFSLRVDALAWLFAMLILAIGALIIVYARAYLPASLSLPRFLALLLLFQGAMMGIALSGNVLLLLVFWELTSLSSFLLIGFRPEQAEARRGSRMALIVTGGGGLFLIAGLLLLGTIAGSFELETILQRGTAVRSASLYPLMLGLILVGCFAKSAQFPFHFWLPRAMAAPTPVSAYLHSATMVKAGIFLLARLWPVLAGTDLWFQVVTGIGLVTMVLGAAVALFRDDLKAILAYSTISHLGLLTMLLGFGTPAAAAAAVFHLVNHAIFKAALFMNAGIVDHEAGTRDLRLLGGLAGLMPIAATSGLIAAASMAGLPPMGGFLSKEMMLEQSLDAGNAHGVALIPILAGIAAALSVAYSLRYVQRVYWGKRPDAYPAQPHDPGPGLWGPPAILVVLTLLVGLFPLALTGGFVVPAIAAVTGGQAPFAPALWHGFTPALGLEAVAVAIGFLLLWKQEAARHLWNRLPLPDAEPLFVGAIRALVGAARQLTSLVHTGSVQRQLRFLFLSGLMVGAAAVIVGGDGVGGGRPPLQAPPIAVLAWLVLLAGVAATVRAQRQRFAALIYISIVGLIVSLAFVYLSAPDLALTQISVEVVTILLLLLALNLLPKQPVSISRPTRRIADAAIGLAGGVAAGLAAWAVMTRTPHDPISAYHWANSYTGGGGNNVVNVTLVDFRAFDTFGEIIVLGIAALTIFALLQPATKGVAGRRLREWIADLPRSPERHPMMFAVAARLLLPLATMIGFYIFLRGHNLPGGGFIAGLILSIAMLMQYMASGFEWVDERRRIDEHLLIGLGVIIAALTGLGSLLFGAPLFSSAFGHFHLPFVGDIELATAMLFDVGVAMTVVGAVMLALAELSHVAQRADKEDEEDTGPMDIDPALLRKGEA